MAVVGSPLESMTTLARGSWLGLQYHTWIPSLFSHLKSNYTTGDNWLPPRGKCYNCCWGIFSYAGYCYSSAQKQSAPYFREQWMVDSARRFLPSSNLPQ
jgi:hypothetical protein